LRLASPLGNGNDMTTSATSTCTTTTGIRTKGYDTHNTATKRSGKESREKE
jgi:hypothetical protein